MPYCLRIRSLKQNCQQKSLKLLGNTLLKKFILVLPAQLLIKLCGDVIPSVEVHCLYFWDLDMLVLLYSTDLTLSHSFISLLHSRANVDQATGF